MKQLFITFFIFSIPLLPYAQGQLLLVGGGSEEQGGWSDQPYGWLVDQAPNHRVAILNDSPSTQWLPNYFDSLGASYAKNFVIDNTTLANAQATYDSLITYDAIFIKGGDQWNYYQLWNSTKVEQAIAQVFNSGGVIGGTSAGMAVLGGVDFTAQNGTVYPDEALANVNDPRVKLDTGFLPLYRDYLFDSHFVERGRLGRLVGFLANRHINNSETISGIGVDDKTALAIRPDSTGLVFGSAAVTLMRSEGAPSFDETSSGSPVFADSLRLSQAIDGDTIDLRTGEINRLPFSSHESEMKFDSLPPKLIMTGGDSLADNQALLQNLVNQGFFEEFRNDTTVLLTGTDTSLALQYKTELQNLGVPDILIKQAVTNTAQDNNLANLIQAAYQFVMVGNTDSSFVSFVNGGQAGTALKNRAHSKDAGFIFIGDNSRFAGETIVTNYQTQYASFDGIMDFKKGLGILPSTVIMPNTYLTSTDDYYENTISGVPYAMMKDSLKWGIWLTPGNSARIQLLLFTNGGGFLDLVAGTGPPLMILNNLAPQHDFSSMPVSSVTNLPRQVAGFDKMQLQTLGDGQQIRLSSSLPVNVEHRSGPPELVKAYPNPADQQLTITLPVDNPKVESVKVLNTMAEVVARKSSHRTTEQLQLSTSELSPGLYLLQVKTARGTYFGKFIKQ